MNELHAGCCAHDQLPVLAAPPANMAAALYRMVKDIWDVKGMPKGLVNAEVTNLIANTLLGGAEEGYGFGFTGIDYDTPDGAMIKALQENIWHFSAAKNYTQLRELSNGLIGSDGKLRTYNEFKEVALGINDKHINQWLKAEYELAVSGSQMAGKWVTIQETKTALPLLIFDAVLDTQTTVLCRNLDGTCLPVDHPFWKTYYPPNHYGERSTVRQAASGKVTKDIPGIDIPPMFQSNLGQDQLIFPQGHPYFIGAPADLKNYRSGR